jgi:hypothetical protein
LTTDAQVGYRPIIGYEVSWSTASGGPFTVLSPLVTTNAWSQSSKTQINWSYGSTLYFRIRANNAQGYSASYSGLLPVVMPTVPNAPTVTNTYKSMTSINFSWNLLTAASDTGNMPLQYYYMEGSTTNFGSLFLSAALSTSTSTYTFLRSSYTYSANTYYYFRVRAVNAAGSTYSNVLAVLTPTVPTQMAAPVATTVSPFSITISWSLYADWPSSGYETITGF